MSSLRFMKWYKVFVKYFIPIVLITIFIIVVSNNFSFASSDIHENKGWVTTDSYRVLNFTVLIVGLFFALRRPVASTLDSRIKSIKNKLKDLESKKVKAEEKLIKYNEKLAKLNEESETIISNYIKQGKEAKDKIISEAKVAARKLQEQAKKNIEHEFTLAKVQLQNEVVDNALVKAEEIIKNKIDLNDQEKLVHEYLEKVVA